MNRTVFSPHRRHPASLVVLGGLLVVLAACGTGPVKGQDVRAGATTPSERPGNLDAYVGFGRSPSTALRDDTVALWEAYQREQRVAGCMEAAAFRYAPSPAFPDEAVRKVAAGLGVQAVAKAPVEPAVVNERASAVLARTDRDRYYRTLMGESLATVEAVESAPEEVVPNDAYATGGCVGKASKAVPGVWDARRSVQSDLAALNRRIGADLAGPYAACVQRASGLDADNPGTLEDLAIGVDPASELRTRAEAALGACRQVWDDGFRTRQNREMPAFIADHQALFDSVQRRYADVTTRIDTDQGFRAYLAQAIAP